MKILRILLKTLLIFPAAFVTCDDPNKEERNNVCVETKHGKDGRPGINGENGQNGGNGGNGGNSDWGRGGNGGNGGDVD